MTAPQARVVENTARRVLGALLPVDATTGAPVQRPLVVRPLSPGWRLQPNRSGLWVVTDGPGLSAHTAAFNAPPPAPAVGTRSMAVEVSDPSGEYLPRRSLVLMPRQPDTDPMDPSIELFRPLHVPLFPSPVARLGANWAALRVSVRDAADGAALGGVWLRVIAGSSVLASGLSDGRGEALVPVAGVPVTTWSATPGAVTAHHIDVTLQALADPVYTTRWLTDSNSPAPRPLVDPTDIDPDDPTLPQASVSLALAAGRPLHVTLSVNLAPGP